MASTATGKRRASLLLVLMTLTAACSAAPGTGGSSQSAGPSSSATTLPAGLPYRLDVPAGWITLGSAGYDTRLDTTTDMRAWLAGLGLEGQNAFRAYEPVGRGEGLRLAVNPQRTWNPSPLQGEGAVAALPGVSGKVSSDVLATGATWKAFGYRWTETMDWGSGTPSSRDCIGYFVMVDPNPVNVVVSYPSGTAREAEAGRIVSTFEMTGTPVFSPPPGESPTPSPTPFDKNATPAPSVASHAAPDLEALLPDTIDGRTVTKESKAGVDAGGTSFLAALGKQPEDLATAQGLVQPGATSVAAVIGVVRVKGVPGDRLLATMLTSMPDAKVSQVTLGGHRVTLVESGAWPVWMYATGDLLYEVGLSQAVAAELFAKLP